MNLFNISQEFLVLQQLAEEIDFNEETGEIIDNTETLAELFNELSNDKLEDKLNNVMYIIKELEVNQNALKDEAARLNKKAKVLENRANNLKEMIKNVIIASGQEKIKTDKFSFTVKTLNEYNYDDVNLFSLGSDFIRVKEELDKIKIKEYVKAGGTIEGLKISDKISLTIR